MRRDDVHLHLSLAGVATIELIYLFDDSFDIGSDSWAGASTQKRSVERRKEDIIKFRAATCVLFCDFAIFLRILFAFWSLS